MPTFRGYLAITENEPWGLTARNVINRMLRGKLNVAGEVTLTPNAATTTLGDQQIGSTSVIALSPMRANAAGALATTYFDAPIDGSVVIRHANNAQTDRTFRYTVIG